MFANDFGQLQGFRLRRNEQELQNYFRSINEGQQLAALDEGYRRSDIVDANNRRDFGANLYFRRLNAGKEAEQQEYARGIDVRDFDYRKAKDAEQLKWRYDENKIDREKLAAHERAVQEQAGIDRFNYEQDLAARGLGGSSNKLSDEENAMLWETRGPARKELELKNNYFRNIADSMNVNPAAYDNMIEQEKSKGWNPASNRWYNDTPDDAAIQEWTSAADVARKRQASAIRAMADKNFPQERIIEREGRYSVPALPWESMVFAPPPLVTPDAPRAASASPDSVLAEAKAAIQRGKDPAIIRQRLVKMGITPDF